MEQRITMKEKIGGGSYKDVYVSPERPGEVTIEFKRKLDNGQIKSAYYLNKIAHLLFPDNVPLLSVAGNTKKSFLRRQKSIIRAERIEHDPGHAKMQQLRADKTSLDSGDTDFFTEQAKKENDPDVKEFINRAKVAGIFVDDGGVNYSKIPGGKVKYLDLNPAWVYKGHTMKLGFNADLLAEAISNLPADKKGIAHGYFLSLNELVALKQAELDLLRRGE